MKQKFQIAVDTKKLCPCGRPWPCGFQCRERARKIIYATIPSYETFATKSDAAAYVRNTDYKVCRVGIMPYVAKKK